MVAHILIIDDDPVLSHLLSRIVESVGHSTVGVKNGIAALEVLKLQQFDLLFLDMYMPELNGWKFLEIYKQLPTPLAPVIIMSAGPVEKESLPDIPLITKPFKSQEILAATAQVLSG
jgi:CheY-like chemotaxis protein